MQKQLSLNFRTCVNCRTQHYQITIAISVLKLRQVTVRVNRIKLLFAKKLGFSLRGNLQSQPLV